MRTLRALWMRLVPGERTQTDFDAELASHLAMHTEDGMRAGLTPDVATPIGPLPAGSYYCHYLGCEKRIGVELLSKPYPIEELARKIRAVLDAGKAATGPAVELRTHRPWH